MSARHSRRRPVLRWLVGGLGDVLVTAGAVLLLFVVWQLWWTDVEANREQSGIVAALDRQFGSAAGPAPAVPVPGSTASPSTPSPTATVEADPGEAFGILRIPRLGGDYARPILEGTDPDTLTRGVGHYEGSAVPGSVGNAAIAGHRTTYGRPFHDIDRLQRGDTVVVETRQAYSVYVVDRSAIVSPTAVEVLAPVPERPGAQPNAAWLTLTACHPKYSAAQRYVVFAKLVETFPRSTGLPAGALASPRWAA